MSDTEGTPYVTFAEGVTLNFGPPSLVICCGDVEVFRFSPDGGASYTSQIDPKTAAGIFCEELVRMWGVGHREKDAQIERLRSALTEISELYDPDECWSIARSALKDG